jgi:hypothetical protein
MTAPHRDDDDGVRVTPHGPRLRPGGVALLVIALLAVAAVGWRVAERRARTADADKGADAASDAGATDASSANASRSSSSATGSRDAATRASAPRDGEDPSRTLADYVLPGEAPRMAEVIRALHARGIHTGLGAFPPPGTRPPLRGLVVPDDFALPPGYVRHHQATDDGQTIAPILMFSPDIDSIDVRGVRVPIPPDRVVPPELAPPGMPLQFVRIPPPRDGEPSP